MKTKIPPHRPGSSRSGSSSTRAQGSAGGPTGSGRQSGPGTQSDMGPGQKTQLQQQAQTAAARPGQPGAPVGAGPQQQPSAQGQGMGMGMGMGPNQAKPGQMGPAGGPMGQARQTGPTGNTPPTMVSINYIILENRNPKAKRFLFLSAPSLSVSSQFS